MKAFLICKKFYKIFQKNIIALLFNNFVKILHVMNENCKIIINFQ